MQSYAMPPIHTSFELLQRFQKAGSALVFRRVAEVVKSDNNLQSIMYHTASAPPRSITYEEYLGLSETEQEQNCELLYSEYSGLTCPTPLHVATDLCKKNKCCEVVDEKLLKEHQKQIAAARLEEKQTGVKRPMAKYPKTHQISFLSEGRCVLDLSSSTSSMFFEPSQRVGGISEPPRKERTVALPTVRAVCMATPEQLDEAARLKAEAKQLFAAEPGNIEAKEMMADRKRLLATTKTILNVPTLIPSDLIVGVLHPENREQYLYWTICSDQFMHMLMALLHNGQDDGTKANKINQLSVVCRCNNRLATNTFKKNTMKIQAKAGLLPIKNQELKKLSGGEEDGRLNWANLTNVQFNVNALCNQLEALELNNQYWHVRYEQVAIDYCHFYTAVVLLALHQKNLDEVDTDDVELDIPNWLRQVRVGGQRVQYVQPQLNYQQQQQQQRVATPPIQKKRPTVAELYNKPPPPVPQPVQQYYTAPPPAMFHSQSIPHQQQYQYVYVYGIPPPHHQQHLTMSVPPQQYIHPNQQYYYM